MTTSDSLELHIRGLDCVDCAVTLERGVGRLPDVRAVAVDFATARMQVESAPGGVNRQAVVAAVRRLGYDVAEASPPLPMEARGARAFWAYARSERRARLTLLALALALVGGLASFVPGADAVRVSALVAATLAGLVHPARAGWGALRTGRGLDINVLMTLAALGALAIGELAEAATVMALFNLGEVLEAFTLDRTRASVRALMAAAPAEALRVAEDHERWVPVDSLAPGDQVRVRPGDRVPADGTVVEGQSAVDQSLVTGESAPADKSFGDPLYAGSINSGNSTLLMRVALAAGESTVARIGRLIERAQAQRSPTQRWVDRFAQRYTPAVVLTAVLLATLPPLLAGQPWRPWLYRSLILLVVACPCALVISTPVSLLSGLARAARMGVLVKGGEYLERLGRLQAIAFDKTGTLTLGRPVLEEIYPDDDTLLALAAAVESGSEHPLARAVAREARHRSLRLPASEGFTALPGRGARARVDGRTMTLGSLELWPDAPGGVVERVRAIEARGKTALVLGDRAGPLAVLTIADQIRPESRPALAMLRELGVVRTVLLTGDNAGAAAAVAREAGVDEFVAGLSPEQKAAAVARLAAEHGEAVAMVGDGINDAPALAQAPVGIAMGAGGTELTLETADVVLVRGDLGLLPKAIRLGRATRATVRQNVAFSLASKSLFVLLALFGLTTLWLAVLADVGASLLITINGMKLLRSSP